MCALRRLKPIDNRPPAVNASVEGLISDANLNFYPFNLGTLAMTSDLQRSEDLSFAQMMSLKSSSRDRQVGSVYASAPQALEMAAARVKAVLRGSSGPLARPQRFSALSS